MRFLLKTTILLLLLSFVFQLNAATKDSTKVRKNLRFSILGGPGYTPDYGFVIGGSMLFTFSTNKKDSTLKRSVIPVAFGYMFNGGGSAFIRPQLFLNHDRLRIQGEMSFNNTLENYYGVGYDVNSSRSKNIDSTQYRSIGFNFNPIVLLRFKETDLFYGASVSAKMTSMSDVATGIITDKDYIASGGDASGINYTMMGLGLNLTYDTRDVPANPYRGILVETSATFYSESFGSTNNFTVYEFTYKQFQALRFIGKRKILAWMLDTRFSTGDVPLSELSMLGSPFNLRGYYMGQYRDRHTTTLLAEYRHMFNFGDETWLKRTGSKMGFVVWGGFGTVNAEFPLMKNFLPNYGLGLRIEVQPRMNFRVDFGRDPINQQTLIYFNMTEAF
ncbi:MAG: BamA/TamA family outer membrane protein [Bacteroidales bacterium]|nr:BamA/TamA family outer membrane protein [Bacteroidales bacterium]